MDPDLYRQEVADSFAAASHWVSALRRVLTVAVVAAAALLLLLWSGRLSEVLGIFIPAWWPRPALRRDLPQPAAIVAAGFTLAAGVLAAALGFDGGRWQRERRFWHRTPDQLRDSLAEQPKDTWVGDYDRRGFDRAVTRATYPDRKRQRSQNRSRQQKPLR